MNDNYAYALRTGKFFKDYTNYTQADWKTNKEYATIAEKAMTFSKRSGKSLEETIVIKWNEIRNGLIMAKDHDFDEFTRGFMAGWLLEKDTTDTPTVATLEDVERIWETKWFNYTNTTLSTKEEEYAKVIYEVQKKRKYKDMGMITLQELTKKCLALMEQGLGDKMVVTFPEKEYILSGKVTVETEELRNSLFMRSENMRNVNANDIVLLT